MATKCTPKELLACPQSALSEYLALSINSMTRISDHDTDHDITCHDYCHFNKLRISAGKRMYWLEYMCAVLAVRSHTPRNAFHLCAADCENAAKTGSAYLPWRQCTGESTWKSADENITHGGRTLLCLSVCSQGIHICMMIFVKNKQ